MGTIAWDGQSLSIVCLSEFSLERMSPICYSISLLTHPLPRRQGRLIQLKKMTVIQELDRFMYAITQNAPLEQAEELNLLVNSTKTSFNG